jgi:hypothetical protein
MKHSMALTERTAGRLTRQTRLFLAVACSVVLFSWNFPTTVEASAGELDTAFGRKGKVVTDFGRNESALATLNMSNQFCFTRPVQ